MVPTFQFSRFYGCGYNAFRLSDNRAEPRGEVFERAFLGCPITGLTQELVLKGSVESPPMFLPETSEKDFKRRWFSKTNFGH